MKKIKFTIEAQILTIQYNYEDNTPININNTNIITDEDLIFDIRYFKNNMKLIAGFLNVMLKNEHVHFAEVLDIELVETAMVFLNYLPIIDSLTIKPDVPIDYDLHLAILKNDTLKNISVYTIPPYLLERIDTTKTVKINTRTEVFYISNFIRVNKLNTYTDVYYKRKLTVTYEFNDTDLQDFEQFLIINKNLKVLYFEYISLELVKKLVKVLKERGRTNILFNIKADPNTLSHFSEIEDYIKKNKTIKKNNYKFRIDYTTEYKLENFLKLLNFTTVKYLLVVVILASIIGYGINEYDIYESSKEVENISENIESLLEEFRQYETTTTTTIPTTTKKGETTKTTTTKKPIDYSAYYKNYAKVISVLKDTNKDTVGWLQVKGTNVNYPVVQSRNNSYYLNHDFTKKNNSMGWVFMDYRDDAKNLKQNTIIYGHNISQTSKIMFGSLKNTLDAKWYKNESNHYITFNTEKKDMQWKVFSVYKVLATNDYLYTDFDNNDEFMNFVDMLKKRSIYDFKTEVKENDRILTLSTCQNSGKYRLVLHAVLVNE